MYPCYTTVLVGLLSFRLISVSRGYELLEGHYTGEKYEPDVLTDEAASEGRAIPGLFGKLIQQLSTVLHQRIMGSRTEDKTAVQDARGRSIPQREDKNDRKTDETDLYYHYYPHNQHIFNLPECATQQVCNAVYMRLNMIQPLCACPATSDPCSASYRSDDEHTIELKMKNAKSMATTLVKTCEPTWSVRECRTPRDWSILALQNTRTGKSHYLVICKCPSSRRMDGPLNHDQPSYAKVPGISVYGMMCNAHHGKRKRQVDKDEIEPDFPWWRIQQALHDEGIRGTLLREGPETSMGQEGLTKEPQLLKEE